MNWSNTVIKYVLFLFNLLFVITGIIFIAVGVSVKTYYEKYDIVLDDKYFSIPNLLIATGSLIFFISFLGCCGAVKENWCMVYGFSIFLIIIFILEFSAGIAGYVLRDKTTDYLENTLMGMIKKYKNENATTDGITVIWDVIQKEFECCGANSPNDWLENAALVDNDLPSSCCKSYHGTSGTTSCSLNTTNAQVFRKGCVEKFGDYVKSHAVTLGGVGIAIAFIQGFGIVFACHLSKQIKNGFYST